MPKYKCCWVRRAANSARFCCCCQRLQSAWPSSCPPVAHECCRLGRNPVFPILTCTPHTHTHTHTCAHSQHKGQLDKAARENKELEERNCKLQVEVATLNNKMKVQKTQMAQLHDSYEAAFEEKTANMQDYVKELEDRWRSLSLAKFSSFSGATATAVSPEGTYMLKSSLTYEGSQDNKSGDVLTAPAQGPSCRSPQGRPQMEKAPLTPSRRRQAVIVSPWASRPSTPQSPPAVLCTQTSSENARGDVSLEQQNASLDLLLQMEGDIQSLQSALLSISTLLVSRGVIPAESTIEQITANEQVEGFKAQVASREDVDNIDLMQLQLSAIANLSAATLLLSSPHVDRSQQSLRFPSARANNRTPDVEVTSSLQSNVGESTPAGNDARLSAISTSISSAMPRGFKGERVESSDVQSGGNRYGAHANLSRKPGKPQPHQQPHATDESFQRALGRRNLSPFVIAFDTCSPGSGTRKDDQGHVLSSCKDEFAKLDDDIHSASERAAREERSRERESLLLSLTEFSPKTGAFPRHSTAGHGGWFVRSPVSRTEAAMTSSFGVWTGSPINAVGQRERHQSPTAPGEAQSQASRNKFLGIRPEVPSEDMQAVMARYCRLQCVTYRQRRHKLVLVECYLAPC
jgi:hypothetical protein